MSNEQKPPKVDFKGLTLSPEMGTAMADINRLSSQLSIPDSLANALSLGEQAAFAKSARSMADLAIGSTATAALKRELEFIKLSEKYRDLTKIVEQTTGAELAHQWAASQHLHHSSIAERFLASSALTDDWSRQLEVSRALEQIQSLAFRLPDASETIASLVANSKLGAVGEMMQQTINESARWHKTLATINIPWLHDSEEMRSVTSLLELQGIGDALRSVHGFDARFTDAIRMDLGDWRDSISFPESVFADSVARTSFYIERGFNASLTDFPEPTFSRGLELAGLLDDEDYDAADIPDLDATTDPVEEAAFRRTNRCHDKLQRLERQLRIFIDAAMTAQYGANWPKRLAPDIRDHWEMKKTKAESDGVVIATLIEVADFTDYLKIIQRKDHWAEVFEVRFKRIESVRESFQRLYPIRLSTMHSRFLTKDDELYLIAESRRILSAIT